MPTPTVSTSGRQSITTKYLPPTNSRGSRIKATCEAGSVTIPYAYERSVAGAIARRAGAARQARMVRALRGRLRAARLRVRGGGVRTVSDAKLTAEESCRRALKTIADACDQESLARAGGYLFRSCRKRPCCATAASAGCAGRRQVAATLGGAEPRVVRENGWFCAP